MIAIIPESTILTECFKLHLVHTLLALFNFCEIDTTALSLLRSKHLTSTVIISVITQVGNVGNGGLHGDT